jgi:flavin-binding protein dodecin
MPQEVIDIVGSSKERFAKTAENAVAKAAKIVPSMKVGARRGIPDGT